MLNDAKVAKKYNYSVVDFKYIATFAPDFFSRNDFQYYIIYNKFTIYEEKD